MQEMQVVRLLVRTSARLLQARVQLLTLWPLPRMESKTLLAKKKFPEYHLIDILHRHSTLRKPVYGPFLGFV